MRKNITTLMKRAIVLMAPFLFIACEKDNGQIGFNKDIIGDLSGLEKDTVAVISYTQAIDSILVALKYNDQRSLGGYKGSRLAGSMIDPVFGKSSAGIVSQMILAQVNPDFGAGPVVDSVRLYLKYNGYYGDTNKSMSLDVYEITEVLSRDSLYYSSFRPGSGQKIGGKENFTPMPNTENDTATTGVTLEIPMDAGYFQTVFADKGNGSFPDFASNEDLIEYFKGIYITPPAGNDGSILYFDLASASSRLVIYYHNSIGSDQIVLNFAQDKATLPINFSVFSQDYTNYPTAFDVSNIDSAAPGAATTYVQSMGGVATIVKVPELKALIQAKGIVVNRAFIEMPVEENIFDDYPAPGNMEIREMTENGPGAVIEDFSFGQSVGDGKLNSAGDKYVFEITQHVFNVLNANINPTLAIVPVNKGTTANRVVLKGGNDPIQPLKLFVYYTKP